MDYIIKEQQAYKERRVEFISSLCVAAVRSYGRHVYDFVNPGHSMIHYRELKADNLKDYALAAAAFLNLKPLVRKLVQDGASHGYSTCFGETTRIVARTGDLEMMISTLDKKGKLRDDILCA